MKTKLLLILSVLWLCGCAHAAESFFNVQYGATSKSLSTPVAVPNGSYIAIRNGGTFTFDNGGLFSGDAAAFRTAIGAGTSSFNGAFSSLTGLPTTLVGYGVTGGANLDALGAHAPSYYLDRANHTGTQLAATISDFNSAVVASLAGATIPGSLALAGNLTVGAGVSTLSYSATSVFPHIHVTPPLDSLQLAPLGANRDLNIGGTAEGQVNIVSGQGLGWLPQSAGPDYGSPASGNGSYGGMQFRKPTEVMTTNFMLFRFPWYVFEDQNANWLMTIANSGKVNVGNQDTNKQPLNSFEVTNSGAGPVISTIPGTNIVVSNNGATSRFVVGQSDSAYGRVGWSYNANEALSKMFIGPIAGSISPPLYLQDAGYNVIIGPTATADLPTAANSLKVAGTTDASTTNSSIYTLGGVYAAKKIIAGTTITAGSSSTVLTDSTGKILSVALNTVDVANGGTGTTNRTLTDSGSVVSVDWANREAKSASGTKVMQWRGPTYALYDGTGALSFNWGNRTGVDSSGSLSVDWLNRVNKDSLERTSVDWQNRVLKNSGGVSNIDWENGWIRDASGVISVYYQGRTLKNASGSNTIDYDAGYGLDPAGLNSFDWSARQLNTTTTMALDWQNRRLSNGSVTTVDWANRTLKSGSVTTFDWGNGVLYDLGADESISAAGRTLSDDTGTIAVNWADRTLQDSGDISTLDWENKTLASGTVTVDWGNKQLKNPDGTLAHSWGNGVVTPITLYVKNVTALTAGAPADIATITLPSGITRWIASATAVGGDSSVASGWIVRETGTGSMIASIFKFRTASGGGGSELWSAGGPNDNAGASAVAPIAAGEFRYSTSSTITVRQTANSANAGTVSFYITIMPLP